MIDLNLPVEPMIFHLTEESPTGFQSCPMYISNVDGSRGVKIGENGEVPEPVAVSQFFLKRFRETAGRKAERYLREDAMPMAVRLAIIDAGTTCEDIEGWPEASDQVPSMQTEDGRKSLAALYLMSVAKNLRSIRNMHMAKRPVDVQQLQVIAILSEQRGCLAGVLAAIAVGINQTVRRGASGRKKQGDATRARVQQMADGLRGRMSKEVAAVKVAEAVGKSTSTVRRLLSELYPGTSWAAER